MPEIFKTRQFVETGDTVVIPDVVLPIPEPESPPEPECPPDPQCPPEEFQSDGGDEHAEELPIFQEPSPPPEPEPLTTQELAALYADELEALRQEARNQAYADALRQKKGELKECVEHVERLLDQLQDDQRQYMARYAEELRYMAVEIAEKIMLTSIDADGMSLAPLVLQSVASVRNAKWLSVELSERLVELVEYIKRELEKEPYRGLAEVVPIAAPPDTCRVVTEDGVLVSTVSVQTKNLKEAFSNVPPD